MRYTLTWPPSLPIHLHGRRQLIKICATLLYTAPPFRGALRHHLRHRLYYIFTQPFILCYTFTHLPILSYTYNTITTEIHSALFHAITLRADLIHTTLLRTTTLRVTLIIVPAAPQSSLTPVLYYTYNKPYIHRFPYNTIPASHYPFTPPLFPTNHYYRHHLRHPPLSYTTSVFALHVHCQKPSPSSITTPFHPNFR